MDSTIVPVAFAYTDRSGARREAQLDYDIAAPRAASDLDIVAGRLAGVLDLTFEQASRVKLVIAARVHQFSLMQLALHNVPLSKAPAEPSRSAALSTAAAAMADTASLRAAAAHLGVTPRCPTQSIAAKLYASATGGGDLAVALSGQQYNVGQSIPSTTLTPAPQRSLRGRGSSGPRGGRRGGGRGGGRGPARGDGDEDDEEEEMDGSGRKRARRVAVADEEHDDKDGEDTDPDDGNLDYCATCGEEGDLLCCDRCPRSYHMECLKIAGDLPEGDWLCPECTRGHEGGTDAAETSSGGYYDGPFLGPRARRGGDVAAELRDIVASIRDSEFAVSFLEPVDPAFRTYYEMIARPMDLTTLRDRLQGNTEYGRGATFDAPRAVTDLRLVWANCKRFNRPMSTIWRLADVLHRETESILRERVRLTPAQTTELRAMRERELMGASLHSAAKSLTASRKQKP